MRLSENSKSHAGHFLGNQGKSTSRGLIWDMMVPNAWGLWGPAHRLRSPGLTRGLLRLPRANPTSTIAFPGQGHTTSTAQPRHRTVAQLKGIPQLESLEGPLQLDQNFAGIHHDGPSKIIPNPRQIDVDPLESSDR